MIRLISNYHPKQNLQETLHLSLLKMNLIQLVGQDWVLCKLKMKILMKLDQKKEKVAISLNKT
jgi:hypothetical protein